MNEDLKQLRKKMDGNDPFLSGGHQIIKVRKREKVIPLWALSDTLTRKFLIEVFPNLKTSEKQRKKAGRWARAIHLYYRLGMPHNQVAEEMPIGYGALRSLLRNIRRAANGLTSDRKKTRGLRPAHRPKKN